MAIPTVYRSTDPGAPVIGNNNTGAYVDLLRKCLVDGYGSKAPAGWSEEFTGTNVAVFRNSVAAGGTGCYVRVSDTVASTSGANPVALNVFGAMSDIDTGTDALPDRWTYRRPDINYSAESWIVIADAVTCWAVVTNGTGRQIMLPIAGFGDITSFVAADAWRYFVAAGGVSSGGNQNGWLGQLNPSSAVPTTGGSSGIAIARAHTGIGGVFGATLAVNFGSAAVGGTNLPAYPSVTGADAAVIPFLLGGSGVLRGKLRGVYAPLHNAMSIPLGTELDDVVAPGSKLIFFPGGGAVTGGGGVWVEAGLDWG